MQLDSITLPDDLLWIDEFEWNPVEQTTDRSLSWRPANGSGAEH